MKFSKKQRELITSTKQKVEELQRLEDMHYQNLLTELGLTHIVNDKWLHAYIFDGTCCLKQVEEKTRSQE